jgi:hypothetical protein
MARLLCTGKIFRSEVMSQLYHQALWAFDHAGHREWFVVLLAVGIAGLFFLRGFGSRSQY